MDKQDDIFYHGSHVLFDEFDLSHALEGDGKVKFGYGVYVTSSYNSAAHYSGADPDAWGVKFREGQFVGPNLLGRLLMELRDDGRLEYSLPDDALGFIETLKR